MFQKCDNIFQHIRLYGDQEHYIHKCTFTTRQTGGCLFTTKGAGPQNKAISVLDSELVDSKLLWIDTF